MKKDFILDALNEIDERFITEAAIYAPKAKTLNFKRAFTIAACLSIVVFSVYALKRNTNTPIQNSTSPTHAAISGFSNEETEIATIDNTGLGSEITLGCSTEASWENKNESGKFTSVSVKGNDYVVSGSCVDYDDLEKVIEYADLKAANSDDKKEYTTTAICYKIKTLNENAFIALKFSQDEDFYVYERIEYCPETLEELIEDLSLQENTSLSDDDSIFHERYGKETSSVTVSKGTDEFKNAFITLLTNNKSAKASTAVYEKAEEVLTFSFTSKIISLHLFFNSEGLLTVSVADGAFSFKLTKEEFCDFVKIVEKYESDRQLSQTTEKSTVNPDTTDSVVTVPPYNPFE